MEVLAVVAMISVIAVSASPVFVSLMRDRRVNRAAMQLVDYLRTGRSMAIGRGQPILVTWNAAGSLPPSFPGGTGVIKMIEPLVTSTTVTNQCGQVVWTNFQPPGTAGGVQLVNSFDIQNGKYDYTSISFFDDTGAAAAYAEICFSSIGRMYIRTGSGGTPSGTFRPAAGVPAFSVINTANGRNRRVFAPPNGVARMQL
jgi:type IV fimbrial biogenesis protein FimT